MKGALAVISDADVLQKPMGADECDFRNGLESISGADHGNGGYGAGDVQAYDEESESMRDAGEAGFVWQTGTRLDLISELFGSCSRVSFNIFSLGVRAVPRRAGAASQVAGGGYRASSNCFFDGDRDDPDGDDDLSAVCDGAGAALLDWGGARAIGDGGSIAGGAGGGGGGAFSLMERLLGRLR